MNAVGVSLNVIKNMFKAYSYTITASKFGITPDEVIRFYTLEKKSCNIIMNFLQVKTQNIRHSYFG